MNDRNQTVYIPSEERQIKSQLRDQIISQLIELPPGKFAYVIDDPNWICAELLYNLRSVLEQKEFGLVFFINKVDSSFEDHVKSSTISERELDELEQKAIIPIGMGSNDFLNWFNSNCSGKKFSFIWHDGTSGMNGTCGGIFSSPKEDLSFLISNQMLDSECQIFLTLNNARKNSGKAVPQFSAFFRNNTKMMRGNYHVLDRNHQKYTDCGGKANPMILGYCKLGKI